MFSSDNDTIPASQAATLSALELALRDQCPDPKNQTEHRIPVGGRDFGPVLQADLTSLVSHVSSTSTARTLSVPWSKPLRLTFNPCEKFWQLNQELAVESAEYQVFKAVLNSTKPELV